MKSKNQQRRLQAASCINDTLGYWRYTFFLKEHSFWKIISEDPYASQQPRVPSHSSEGSDMGVRKHISRLSLSQSLSHFRTHLFP
jgi:hypothetical protein